MGKGIGSPAEKMSYVSCRNMSLFWWNFINTELGSITKEIVSFLSLAAYMTVVMG